MEPNRIRVDLAETHPDPKVLDRLVTDRVASRLFSQDPSLWGSEFVSLTESRLGWVSAIQRIGEVISRSIQLRDGFLRGGVKDVILCGMGGSSLAAQVMNGSVQGSLTTLDSTHPTDVERVLSSEHLRSAVCVVSTKSGSTVETRSMLALVEARYRELGIEPAERIIVITDPGSALDDYSGQEGYTVIHADSTVGGRYSALTAFGLTPVVLSGADLQGYEEHAQLAAAMFARDEAANPVLQVAVALHILNRRHHVVEFLADGRLALLPAWIEQLIAESSGKHGRGLLPIPRTSDDESHVGTPVVQLFENAGEHTRTTGALTVSGDLASQFLFWECVTAVLCHLEGVNPFDQPDVESTKQMTGKLLVEGTSERAELEILPGVAVVSAAETEGPRSPKQLLDVIRAGVTDSRYLVLQAYCAWSQSDTRAQLRALGNRLQRLTDLPVAVSPGPQYLHSTGQFHKGGPEVGMFFQVIQDVPESQDLEIPGRTETFLTLLKSACLADAAVLSDLGRPVITVKASSLDSLEAFVTALSPQK